MANTEVDPVGRWVVVDHFGAVTSLLAVGDQEHAGVSPRRNLDRRAREVLLPALSEVIGSGAALRRIVHLGGDAYQVDARPVITPDRSHVTGAYGVFVPAADPVPEPPLIGAWQWTVDTSGNNVGSTSSQWDAGLYRLHEFSPDDVQSSRGPVGDWLTRLLPYEERARVKTTVDAGLAAANGVHQLLTFGAVTRPDTPNPGRKQLALVGTSTVLPDRPGVFYAYGFTREVPKPSTYRTTGLDIVDAAEFARAYFALAGDVAYAAVDCLQSSTFMTSPSWGRLGLHEPFEGDIASLALAEDRPAFEEFVAAARRSVDHDAATHDVRLVRDDGSPARFRVRAARVDRTAAASRYLLLSFEARS
ncbi:hypothetical protein DEI93_12865 [Curtobacterium sp. MCBD17_035]|uniref:hypothetical protein n=1 Tax=Curtobacterium sp. MCBD17_035 TaxID=2175673 RepID=UPI000DAAA899|nr:hypothetical protein [Curtobacterium sp. MCBD17_035]WIB66840.1 hypothetical protein DEI93_12865 [Curtobacterium sp. MCBD17_035]